MKTRSVSATVAALILMGATAMAGDTNLVITSFDGGTLTWTNIDPELYYHVEWLPSLTATNAWTGSFRGMQDLQSTNGSITVSVPMFYRVVGTSSPTYTYTLSADSLLIPAGYYEGGSLLQIDPDLVSANIRAGTVLFGVSGDTAVVDTSTGNAQQGEILFGKRAWADGEEVAGSMPDRAAMVFTPGTTQQVIPAGYHNGAGSVQGDADLIPENIVLGVELFGIAGLYGQYHADGFPTPVAKSLWDTYDSGANGIGVSPKGYMGAVFDGRYVYFVPLNNSVYHGEVLRLDTEADFSTTNAWASFNPGAEGVGSNPVGYTGGVFDGRYVYFAPYNTGTAYHGEVLRLDTLADFGTTNAWTTYTPHDHGVGDHVGYLGAVFDGRYVYFSPEYDGVRHGEVLRYDTQGTFDSTNSWAAFDPGSQGVGTDPDGYNGGIFDGRYIYFVPGHNGTRYHSEVLRYDTQSTFNTTNAWSTFDPTANAVASGAGYYGGVFDGRYVYIIPHYNGSAHYGQFVRYDTQADFSTAGSWTAYDPGVAGVGSDPDGYFGAVFDGQYVYFVPYHNGSAYSGEILRFNSQGNFQNTASWSSYTPYLNGISTTARGFRCGAFDGRHVYFVPYYNGTGFSGEVLRFDAKDPAGIPSTIVGGSFF